MLEEVENAMSQKTSSRKHQSKLEAESNHDPEVPYDVKLRAKLIVHYDEPDVDNQPRTEYFEYEVHP